MGIEPTSEAWEASILPLYDARFAFLPKRIIHNALTPRTAPRLPHASSAISRCQSLRTRATPPKRSAERNISPRAKIGPG